MGLYCADGFEWIEKSHVSYEVVTRPLQEDELQIENHTEIASIWLAPWIRHSH